VTVPDKADKTLQEGENDQLCMTIYN